jgi:rubrerythrin
LAGKGFKKIYNLKGGIMAWNGQVASGPVELNLDLVRGDESPAEITRLAYGMEMSLGSFYETMSTRIGDKEVLGLLSQLVSIEEKHKQYLLEMLGLIEPSGVDRAAFESDISSTIMEGGFDSDEFIEKNEEFMRSVTGLLDVAMMLETQALDLYLRFAEKIGNEEAKKILYKIGDEEKGHLAALGRLREEKT